MGVLFLDGKHSLLAMVAECADNLHRCVCGSVHYGAVLWFTANCTETKYRSRSFLGACTLPLPFLVRWAVQHVKKSNTIETDSSDGNEIKTILHESFRPSNRRRHRNGVLGKRPDWSKIRPFCVCTRSSLILWFAYCAWSAHAF